MKEVKVYARMHGDYSAWHEVTMKVVYDITNSIKLDKYTLEECKAEADNPQDEYGDIDEMKALLIDGEYYIKLYKKK